MKPKVAIVGRVNTGKSTLFNRLIGKPLAIYKDEPGVTRDSLIGEVEWNGYVFDVIDTGGFMPVEEIAEIYEEIKEQIREVLQEVEAIIFLLDGKVGLHPGDKELARMVRETQKKVFPVVNKIDTKLAQQNMGEFWELGFENLYFVSAEHSIDVDELLDDLVSYLKSVFISNDTEEDVLNGEEKIYRLALVGRRNAGKSTFFNRLFGKKRVIVSSIPGTTRDPVEEIIELAGKKFSLVDTAGFFRKRKIKKDVDFYSYLRSYKSISKADIVIFMIDSTQNITREDKQIFSFIEENKKPSIVILNKSDLWERKPNFEDIEAYIRAEVHFIYSPIVPMSAKTGEGYELFLEELERMLQRFQQKIPSREIISFLKELFIITPPPLGPGKKALKLKFAVIEKNVPFTLTLFLNEIGLSDSYIAFLKRELRKTYDLAGIPIVIKEKKDEK